MDNNPLDGKTRSYKLGWYFADGVTKLCQGYALYFIFQKFIGFVGNFWIWCLDAMI